MSFAFWDVGSTAQRKILLYYYTTKMMLDVPWVQISHHANIITNRRKMTIHTKAKRFDLIRHLILNLVTTTWYCNMIFISFQVSRNVIQLRNPSNAFSYTKRRLLRSNTKMKLISSFYFETETTQVEVVEKNKKNCNLECQGGNFLSRKGIFVRLWCWLGAANKSQKNGHRATLTNTTSSLLIVREHCRAILFNTRVENRWCQLKKPTQKLQKGGIRF